LLDFNERGHRWKFNKFRRLSPDIGQDYSNPFGNSEANASAPRGSGDNVEAGFDRNARSTCDSIGKHIA